ncbi:hypothetical protein D3C87_102890 [compost metagenome]
MNSKVENQIFIIKEVSSQEFNLVLDRHFNEVFKNRVDSNSSWSIDDSAKNKINKRKKHDQRYQLRLLIYLNEEVVGWHFGYASDAETYYMQNSAILDKYRNRGAYSQLLSAVLEKLHQDGFQVVSSTHHPNNTAVLIPKLKKGFIVSGVNFHERFRFLIELKYFFNKDRRASYSKNLGLDIG